MKRILILILILSLSLSTNCFALTVEYVDKNSISENYKEINPFYNSKIHLFWEVDNNKEWIKKDEEFILRFKKLKNNKNIINYFKNQITKIEGVLEKEREKNIKIEDVLVYSPEITENIMLLNLAKNNRLDFLGEKIKYEYPLDEIDNDYVEVEKSFKNIDFQFQFIKVYNFLNNNDSLVISELLKNKSIYISKYKLKNIKGYTTQYPNKNKYIYLGVEDKVNTIIRLENMYSNTNNDIIGVLYHEIGHLFFQNYVKKNIYFFNKYKELTNTSFDNNIWALNLEESFSEYFKIKYYNEYYLTEQKLYLIENYSKIIINQNNFNKYIDEIIEKNKKRGAL